MSPSEQPELSHYHVFSTPKEAETWIDEKALAWNQLLTPEELRAVRTYKGSKGDEYQKINNYLRQRGSLTEAEQQKVRQLLPALDSALRKGTIDRALRLYRGVRPYEGLDYQVGAVVLDRAYFSLTADRDLAHSLAGTFEPGFVLEMLVPAGKRAGFPDRLGVSEGELEVLLGRGTLYTVLNVQKPMNPAGHTVVTIEVHP